LRRDIRRERKRSAWVMVTEMRRFVLQVFAKLSRFMVAIIKVEN
jgi:hypothetical protein